MNNILKAMKKENFIQTEAIKIMFSSNVLSFYYFVAGEYSSINEIKSKSECRQRTTNLSRKPNFFLEMKDEMLGKKDKINKIHFELSDLKLSLQKNK